MVALNWSFLFFFNWVVVMEVGGGGVRGASFRRDRLPQSLVCTALFCWGWTCTYEACMSFGMSNNVRCFLVVFHICLEREHLLCLLRSFSCLLVRGHQEQQYLRVFHPHFFAFRQALIDVLPIPAFFSFFFLYSRDARRHELR